ncbi:MAG: hypothetical protein HQK58_12780 [Deltaproteobacteria bacterium]|nr:hypothetical protein [Deltaproteobacteria bacterium]
MLIKHVVPKRLTVTILVLMLLGSVLVKEAAAAAGQIVSYGPGKHLALDKDREGWQAIAEGQAYTLRVDAQGAMTFLKNGRAVANGKLRGSMAKLSAAGSSYGQLKLKADKIKIALADDGFYGWTLKYKTDKIKVLKNRKKVGKVVFYPNTGKLKAKDVKNQEVAVMAGSSRISGILAPFLMGNEVNMDRRVCLVLMLLALNR